MMDDTLDRQLARLAERLPDLDPDFAETVRARTQDKGDARGSRTGLAPAISVRAAPALLALAIGILAGGLAVGRTDPPDALAVFDTGTDHLLGGRLFDEDGRS